MADGDERTPPIATMLEDDGSDITLTVPLDQLTGPYTRWFTPDAWILDDDVEAARRRPAVPEQLWFSDVRGHVALVGCRSAGYTFGTHGSEGRIHARFAVLDAGPGADYRAIHGLRSQVPALSHWLNLRSLNHSIVTDNEGRLATLDLHLEAPNSLPIDRKLNLTIRPHFTFAVPATAGTSTIEESLQIQTHTKASLPWSEHWDAHAMVLDLVRLAAWQDLGYSQQWVTRDDDPVRVLSGEAKGIRWARLRTRLSPLDTGEGKNPRFLFTFDDISAKGIRRWRLLRWKYQRGLGPIMSTIGRSDVAVETRVSQLGMGLEAIGYQLALEAGLSKATANKEDHAGRLRRVLDDCTITPPFAAESWVTAATAAYNGLKHANRNLPDILDLANVMRQNQLVFRIWVAGRIGVRRDRLQRSLVIDPMAKPYVELE